MIPPPAPPPSDSDPVERAVRDHLLGEEARVDAAAVLARVKAARAAAMPLAEPYSRRRWLRAAAGIGLGATAAAAACLVIAFGGGGEPTPLLASPAELVREAQQVHSDATDRCYAVKVERGAMPPWPGFGGPPRADGPPRPDGPPRGDGPSHARPSHRDGRDRDGRDRDGRDSRDGHRPGGFGRSGPGGPGGPFPYWMLLRDSKVWTRGNLFWIDSSPDGRRADWGRDRDGRVWVAVNPKHGILFGKDEVSDPLARACDLMSLRVPSLMADLLDQYDLSRADAGRSPDDPIRIEGTSRHGPTDFVASRVTLELDPRTKIIRKAVQKRVVGSEVLATFTYTLVETGRQPDDAYELAGHLEPGASVIDGKDKSRREQFKGQFVGRFPGGRPAAPLPRPKD